MLDRYTDSDDNLRLHESVAKVHEVREGLTLPRGGREVSWGS
jgi:hypothetical protein